MPRIRRSVPSFYRLGPDNPAHVIRRDSRSLCPPSCLATIMEMSQVSTCSSLGFALCSLLCGVGSLTGNWIETPKHFRCVCGKWTWETFNEAPGRGISPGSAACTLPEILEPTKGTFASVTPSSLHNSPKMTSFFRRGSR